jgi:hypothetical protein
MKTNNIIMMKRLHILVVLLAVCLSVSAQSISEQQAREQAVQFLMSDPGRSGTRQAMKQRPQLETAAVGTSGLYVFNVEGGGFVVASGDARALPVLGYSATGRFDWDRMPENMRWWLQEYSRAIAALGNTQLPSQTRAEETRAAIAPMIKCLWGQKAPYNHLCPIYDGDVTNYKGERCVTGCTATAMAQVMAFHQWPKKATTSIPAYQYEVSNVRQRPLLRETFSAEALEPITFDWKNMLDTYLDEPDEEGQRNVRSNVTKAQRNAVAQLMRYCGQSVQMSYSPTVSLAWVPPIADALRNYFGYDQGVMFVDRRGVSIEKWEKGIYDELAAGRPVVFSGTSTDGGHTFVCDGYDGAGLYHFDWGWNGDCNNYFSLSVLNPNIYDNYVAYEASFSYAHGAVIGIQPPKEGTQPAPSWPVVQFYTKPYIATKDGQERLYFDVMYANLVPEATFSIELFVKDETTGIFTQTSDFKLSVKMKSQDPCPIIITLPATFKGEDRTFDTYIGMLCTSVEGAQWSIISGETTVIRTTVKDGQATYVVMPSAAGLSIQSGRITRGMGTVGTNNDLTLTIQNKGEEYTGQVCLEEYFIGNDDPAEAFKAIYNDPVKLGGYTLEHTSQAGAYIKANSSADVLFSFRPKSEGTYLFILYEALYDEKIQLLNRPLAYCSLSTSSTGIQTIETKVEGEDTPYYNLSGQKVVPQRKGIYIHNGKKVILR